MGFEFVASYYNGCWFRW